MDEASQVDVTTGALALSCAKNAVIVGDTKQLPNVITEDIKIERILYSNLLIFQVHTIILKIAFFNQFAELFLMSLIHFFVNITVAILKLLTFVMKNFMVAILL